MKPSAAIILDNLSLRKWQIDALEEAKKKINITLILNCKNTRIKKKIFKNFFYYILNIFSLKNFLNKEIKFDYSNIKIINFNSIYNKSWQSLPGEVINRLNNENINLIIKFGMNLLKIEKNLLNFPILSFHHGDPSKYRGRPAGFYEMLNKETTIGIVVQLINNKLDSGRVLAFAESKVVNFSYSKTAINFYSNSKFLLSKAIDNLLNKKEINIKKNGKNYKLPNNLTVLRFIVLILKNLIRKLLYGIFIEKKWKVAVTKNQLLFNSNETIPSNNLRNVPINKKYSFYADPFLSCNKKLIRLEALNKWNGLGEVLNISIDNFKDQKKFLSGNHYSYPFSFLYKKKEYLLPEVSSYSSQYILFVDKNNKKKFLIKGLENKRIVDATLFRYKKYWYLFFGENNNASTILNLWISGSLFSNFKPHPKTPIIISPKFARMGGSILRLKNRILRFGQNNAGEYGETLSVQEIDKLTPKDYSERHIGYLKVDKYKGPHTLNINDKGKQLIFDYYVNEFSFFAGFRRFMAWLNK